jgi:hypothetical protein
MDAVLTIALKKIVDIVGGEASDALKQFKKGRTEYALFNGLRSLEDVLDRAPKIILDASEYVKRPYRVHDEFLQREIQGFVFEFLEALDNTQTAFEALQSKLEIYGSRETRDKLNSLLGSDSEAMYLFHDNYNNERVSAEQWTNLFSSLSVEVSKARKSIADFIKDNYDLK